MTWPRTLIGWAVSCDVMAPSLIPQSAGDKVKSDTRDARRLARPHRAGELTRGQLPTRSRKRGMGGGRVDVVIERTKARHRLRKFKLRHS